MTVPPPAMLPKPARAQSMPNNENVWNRRNSILPSLSFKKSSNIEIVLGGENQFIHSYSTFDEIDGHVILRFEKDTCIDDFSISLQGQTNTWVEKVATTSPTMGRTTGKHTFLRVYQPIDQDCLPEFNKALAGQIYTIPFKFVVPDRILDFTCSHRVDDDSVKGHHLELPPSIGDPMLAGHGNTLMDDLAPNMAKINYSIQVTLLKASPNIRRPETVQESLGVRIVPFREELPPISLEHLHNPKGSSRPKYFCLRKEKNIRRGIFKIGKKQGRLIGESSQPASLKMHHPSQSMSEPITTTATVQLRYDPALVDEQPPQLSTVVSKIKVFTFFGAAPWAYLPAPEAYDVWSTVHSQYPEAVDLSTTNLTNVEWVKHEVGVASAVLSTSASRSNSVTLPGAYEKHASKQMSTSIPSSYSAGTHTSRSTADSPVMRRASTFSAASSNSSNTGSEDDSSSSPSSRASSTINLPQTSSIASPSTSYNPSLPYYTASIMIPITLPTTTSPISSTSATASTTTSPSTSRRPSVNPTTSNTTLPKLQTNTKSKKPMTFLPTFHSCLISRTYSLELSVHAQSAPTLNLRIPIQISLPYNNIPHTNQPQTLLSQSMPMPMPHQAWFDPFSTSESPTQDQQDLANDEAIARILAQQDADREHGYGSLGAVPEYETIASNAPPGTGLSMAARRASLPLFNARPDEAPPEYDSTVRRSSAARRAAANAAAAAANSGSSNNPFAGLRRGSGSGSGGGSKGDGRRRFSLLS